MGIDAYVYKAKDLKQGDLYTPILSNGFFKKCWMPAINSLNLEYIRFFLPGLDITKDNLAFVVDELQKIREWAKVNLSEGERSYMVESIMKLQNMLDTAFKHEDVVVFIG